MLSVILLSMLMIILSPDQASDLWQQLELASALLFDLQDSVEFGTKWIVEFNARKTELVLLDWSNNTGVINVWVGIFLRRNDLFRC